MGTVVVISEITSHDVVRYVQIKESEVGVEHDLKLTIPFWISICRWR